MAINRSKKRQKSTKRGLGRIKRSKTTIDKIKELQVDWGTNLK